MITANVDCSDKGNVTQAKHELHRAGETGDSAARTILLGDWAAKWGDALIDVAEDYKEFDDSYEIDELERENGLLEEENFDLENKIDELEGEIEELKAKIEELEAK